MDEIKGKDNLKARWGSLSYDIEKFERIFTKPNSFYNHKQFYDYKKRYERLMKRLKKLNSDSKLFLKEMEEKN